MLERLRVLLFGTLRRQLILGVALVHAVMMTLFIWDLTVRQQAMLLDRQTEHATALARSIATTSAGWVAARDYYGLREIVLTQSRYPELLFAMILDTRGRVVAHSDTTRLGQFVSDLPSSGSKNGDIILLSHGAALVDVLSPITLAGRQVGWVRVGLGQRVIGQQLAVLIRDGILYALAAIVIGSLLASYMGRRLTRRLNAIQQVTDAIHTGDNSRRVSVTGADEAAHLARQFNEMLDGLAQREAALRDRETHLHTLLQTLPDLVWLKDQHGVYLSCNTRFERFFGAREADIVGKTDYDFVERELADSFREHDKKAMAAGGPSVNEEWIPFADDGHRELLETIKTPMFNASGKLIGVLGIGRDITARKRAEAELTQHREHLEDLVATRTRELEAARDAAEAANRMKSVFLANMSHELRTPLNAILGFAQLMERDARIPEDERKNLAIINNSGKHLLNLINDVLEISRIEAGRLSLKRETIDLHELLASLTEIMALRAQGKGLALRLERAVALPRFIVGDLGKLRQILLNLLSNAVKYTPHGEVVLAAGVAEPDANTPEGASSLVFEVRDTGVGIEADAHEKIFQPFYQTEYGIQLGEGTGLGLTICREYARLVGGSLSVDSTPGVGSTFRFVLPAEPAPPPEHLDTPRGHVVRLAPDQPAYRILVAEDQPDNQRLITQLLRQVGFQCRVADNGRDAVELFQSWHPHLIWMDMRMPVMNGYQAARAIRALPGGARVPIVALTASAFEEDEADILAAGCDEILKKPIRQDRFYDVMARKLDLRYLYVREPREPTHPERLANGGLKGLPAAQLQALASAAEQLDTDAVAAAIAAIRENDKALANDLAQLADDYEFDRIARACREAAGGIHDDTEATP